MNRPSRGVATMMRAPVLLGFVFAALTAIIAVEAARFAVDGIEALAGIGMPRMVMPGLMNIGLAVLAFALARRTLLLARLHFVKMRIARARGRVK